MIKVIKAKERYKPNIGDLLCEMVNKESAEYLVAEEGPGTEKAIPLACAHPNPWLALYKFSIDASPLSVTYICPYTEYKHCAIVPVALLINGDVNAYKDVKFHSPDYLLDWEFHKHLFKEQRLDLQPIQKLLLGSGYKSGCSFYDGSPGLEKRRVMLDNGDALWVIFWEWYNK